MGQRDPNNHPLRVNCTYFVDYPDPDLTPASVVIALRLPAGDARCTAYVRWQLLSALPAQLDEETTAQLLLAYHAAPAPLPRPGILRADQQRMDRLIQRLREADEPDLARQFERAVDLVVRQNGPILGYRDELYHRLPKDVDTFAAAMDDLLDRCNAAADGKGLLKGMARDMRTWLASDPAPPGVLAQLAEALRRLAEMRGPQYYQTVYWSDRSHALMWRKTRARVDSGHTLKDLAAALEEQSRRPPLKMDIKSPSPNNTDGKLGH